MEENNNEISLDDLDQVEAQTQKKLEVKDRYAKLSEKMALEAKQRTEAEAKAKAEADARSKAEKERDFYRDFSKLSGQYPHALSYQEKILEKVNSGYSPEDATLAILAKEGKLGPAQAPVQTDVAGGSASISMTETDKNPNEMTQAERLTALQDLEKQGVNFFKL